MTVMFPVNIVNYIVAKSINLSTLIDIVSKFPVRHKILMFVVHNEDIFLVVQQIVYILISMGDLKDSD